MGFAEIIQLIAQTGGLLGLSIFAIWMLNKVWQARLDEEKRHSEQMRHVYEQMRGALEKNTEAITRLSERLKP